MPSTASPRVGDRVAELDLMRGLGALLMVLNHVGYATLSPQEATQGVTGAVVFLGSFAPVLFFFVTGFSGGLAARAHTWSSLLDKVVLLVVADQLFGWSHGRPWTLDFFGFIAVAMVATRLLRSAPRPVLAAGLAIALVVALRYAMGKPLDAMLHGDGVLRWVLGVTPQDFVSYPAAPWLIYPLLGLALGVLYRQHAARVPKWTWAVMAAAAVLCTGAAAWVAWRGGSLHRWSSVSAAYFLASLAVLVAAAALSVGLTRASPRAAAMLSLGGVASFAVVPLHYVVVRSGALGAQTGLALYLGIALLIALTSFVLSRAFERRASALSQSSSRAAWTYAALLLIGAGAVATLAAARAGAPALAQLAATVGQLSIGLLFAWRVGLFGGPALTPGHNLR